jgi:hypothetical protein
MIKPGQRIGARTEFKKGQKARNALPVGSVTIRIDRSGTRRAWVKVAAPNKWKRRAVVVWEAANGPTPKGHVIHHMDFDSLNDGLSNLEPLTRPEHSAKHRREMHIAAVAAIDGVSAREFTIQWIKRGRGP